MGSILVMVWAFFNSPAGITAMASGALWLLNKVYAKKPVYEKYVGTLITAIRKAEREIPDNTPNAGLARLDAALKYVLDVYERVEQRQADARIRAELAEGIQLMHNELEQEGILAMHRHGDEEAA